MIPVSRLLTLALAATAVGCGHHRCGCNAPGSQAEQHRILSVSPAPASVITTGRQSGASHTTDEPPQVAPGSAAAEPVEPQNLAAAEPAGQGGVPALRGVPGTPGQIVDAAGRVTAPVVVVTRNDPPVDLSRILATAATAPDGPSLIIPAVATVPDRRSLIIPAFAGAAEEPAEPVPARRRSFSVQVTTGAPMQVSTPAPTAAPVPTGEAVAPPVLMPLPPAAVSPVARAPGRGVPEAPLPEEDPNCRHAHAADYSWVVGELRYLHTRKCWQVRYAPLEVEDDYGGSFLLSGVDHLAAQFHEGQIVKVSGVVLRPERHKASTMYWADSVKRLR